MWNKVYITNGLGRPRFDDPLHRVSARVNPSTREYLDSVGHAKLRLLIKKAMEDGYDGRN